KMTLKIGKFNSAGEAVRTGVELGIDGHSFTPVRDPRTNRYTLHFGEFTGWKDAIAIMEAIKAKNSALDVVVWQIPASSDSHAGFHATLDKTTVRGALWYRVHVGGFKSQEDARRAVPRIEKTGHVTSGATVVKL